MPTVTTINLGRGTYLTSFVLITSTITYVEQPFHTSIRRILYFPRLMNRNTCNMYNFEPRIVLPMTWYYIS